MSQRYFSVSPKIHRFPLIGLLVVISLIILAACSPAASAPLPFTEAPAVSPLAEKVSAAPAADQRTHQDQLATAEPVPETGPQPEAVPNPEPAATIPVTVALGNPKELIQSALDLALQGDSQGVYRLGLTGDLSYIPVLVDMLRLSRGLPAAETQSTIYVALGDIAMQNFPEFDAAEATGWSWWVKWLGQNPEINPPPGYAGWKGRLYSRLVDPEMGDFLYSGVKTNIRLGEVVWGGVGKDGIPDLTNPPVIDAEEAGYLDADERVFGVSFNGEHRAYPHRILNAHEMANDVVGGVPFGLAY